MGLPAHITESVNAAIEQIARSVEAANTAVDQAEAEAEAANVRRALNAYSAQAEALMRDLPKLEAEMSGSDRHRHDARANRLLDRYPTVMSYLAR